MTSVLNIPGRNFEVFVVGSDRKIWHSKDQRNGFDAGVVISQICITNNQRALFAGVGEEGRPGAVKILGVPLGFLTEV